MFIDSNGVKRKPIAYLADFEMFLPTADETIKYWKQVCDKYGIIGLYPPDTPAEDNLKPYEAKDDSYQERVKHIFSCDYNQMQRSDICIAQLDNWRGLNPDSGTAFELGWFAGKKKPIYGFLRFPCSMIYRVQDKKLEDGTYYDTHGYAFEDRDFPLDNIYATVTVRQTFEEICQAIRADFDKQLIEAGYEPYEVK